jgi:DNA-binding NtrC family response regulator
MAVVLIVEDEKFIRESAEWTIRDLGHDTLVAGDVAEALAHLRVTQPIDALFVDIRLDKAALGGYEVANQAVQFWPGLRVLYTSGTPYCADMIERFVRGGQFIQKPYFPDQLEFSVKNLLGGPADNFVQAALNPVT